MNARLIEGRGHRPLILFEDGRVGIPVNLHFLSRNDFISVLGKQVEVVSRLSDLPFLGRPGIRLEGYALGSVSSMSPPPRGPSRS